MKLTSFAKEGYKRIKCSNCDFFITKSYMGEEKVRAIKCRNCGSTTLIFPPQKGIIGGEKVIFFGPHGGTWTADKTHTPKEENFFALEWAKLTDEERKKLTFNTNLTEEEIGDIFSLARNRSQIKN